MSSTAALGGSSRRPTVSGIPRPEHESEYSWHSKQYIGSGRFERDLDDQILRLQQLIDADEETRSGLYTATERNVAATLTGVTIRDERGRRAAAKLILKDSFLFHHRMEAGTRSCPLCAAARSEEEIRRESADLSAAGDFGTTTSLPQEGAENEVSMDEELPSAKSSSKRRLTEEDEMLPKRLRLEPNNDDDPLLEETLQFMADEVLQPSHAAAIPVSSSSSSSSPVGETSVGDPGSAGLAAQNDPPFEVFDIFEGDTLGLDDP